MIYVYNEKHNIMIIAPYRCGSIFLETQGHEYGFNLLYPTDIIGKRVNPKTIFRINRHPYRRFVSWYHDFGGNVDSDRFIVKFHENANLLKTTFVENYFKDEHTCPVSIIHKTCVYYNSNIETHWLDLLDLNSALGIETKPTVETKEISFCENAFILDEWMNTIKPWFEKLFASEINFYKNTKFYKKFPLIS